MVFPRVHETGLAIELPSGYLELSQPTLATTLLNTYILTLYFTETSAYMLLQLVGDENINDVLLALTFDGKKGNASKKFVA